MKGTLELIGGILVIAIFPLVLLSIWYGVFFLKLAATDFVIVFFLGLTSKVLESTKE